MSASLPSLTHQPILQNPLEPNPGLTFSDSESAEKVGKHVGKYKYFRKGSRGKRESGGNEGQWGGQPQKATVRGSHPFAPRVTGPRDDINLMSLYIIIKVSPVNDGVPVRTEEGLIIGINQRCYLRVLLG